MIDPPRAAVPDAVSKCRSAGIKIEIDNPVNDVSVQEIGGSRRGRDQESNEDVEKQLFEFSYTGAFGDGARNFEPWSSDVDDT
ncbi:hypothetical protein TNCV_2024941 [Trichonephila clavipes]|nr:hypothetical protein TNCV_2024941 [Trichonephila clavipes]